MMSSETASVFEVPSVMPAMPTRLREVRPGAYVLTGAMSMFGEPIS